MPTAPQNAAANAFALTFPGTLGNLDSYIQAVHRIPMLTPEEELSLARDLRDNDSVDAARRMVMSHLRLVVSIARQYLGYGLPHADLIQ
ncbi:MAG TPA: RNA polymerase sigma factor RpoH, partial [Cupriavidus sp.]|nr:RNA polymerase sigma factor RpoH [Cupriavidus sp.]